MIAPASTDELEELLSRPTPELVNLMRRLPGDLVLLGVAGKMGPSMARMARRAADLAGTPRRVIGVSRFRDAAARAALERYGVETLACDLLDARAVDALPEAPLVVHLAGMKFGATGQESLTWAMNAWLPGIVCQKYANSRIVAFSTGNVYGLTPVAGGGSRETDSPSPVGEYAMSCLGRERIFEHFSRVQGTRVALVRLNYACDLRYGVLVDVAQKILSGHPVDVSMGYLNTIWQGDANALALLALEQATSPAWTVNLTGPQRLSVRAAALRLGELLGRPVHITGEEAADALLSDASRCFAVLGRPSMSEEQLLEAVAHWASHGGEWLGKPTHFESRDGRF